MSIYPKTCLFLLLLTAVLSCTKEGPAVEEDLQLVEEQVDEPLSIQYTTSCMELMLEAEGGVPPYEYSLNGEAFTRLDANQPIQLSVVGLNRVCVRDAVKSLSDTLVTNAVPMLLAYDLRCTDEGQSLLSLEYINCGEPPFFLFANGVFINQIAEGWLLEPGEQELVFMDQKGRKSGALALTVAEKVDCMPTITSFNPDSGVAILHVEVTGGLEPYAISLNGGESFGATGAYYFAVYLGQSLQIQAKDQKGCESSIAFFDIEG